MIDSGNDLYSLIFAKLSGFLPKNWEKLVVYLEYGETMYSFRFYVKEQGRYVLCYDLPGVEDKDLRTAFGEIDKFVSVERSSLKSPWTNMTMVVEPPNKMHADFDYTDFSEGTYEYEKAWKAKYLSESVPQTTVKTRSESDLKKPKGDNKSNLEDTGSPEGQDYGPLHKDLNHSDYKRLENTQRGTVKGSSSVHLKVVPMIDNGNDLYSLIFAKLSGFLPKNWEKLVVYLEYGETMYSFRFYVKEQGRYVLCYDLPGVEDKDLRTAFGEIDKFVSVERSSLKSPWTNMTMIVEPPNKMHADFDYTDLSEGTYKYEKAWKVKYLGESAPQKTVKIRGKSDER